MDHDDGNNQVTAEWEESAGDLLAQFQARSSEPAVEPASPSSIPVEGRPGQSLAAVEPPTLVDSDEYDFLPGHFDVYRVLSEKYISNTPASYQVKMRSGELQTVSPSGLQALSYCQEALDGFHGQDDLLELHDSDGHRLRMREASSDNALFHSSWETRHTSIDAVDRGYGSPGSDIRKMRRSRRTTKPRNQFSAYFYNLSSDDENARVNGPSSSDDIITSASSRPRRLRLRTRPQSLRTTRRLPVISDTDSEDAGPRKTRPRPSRTTRHLAMLSDTDSDYTGPKGTRFSTRQRKPQRKNLREKLEDDISEHEEVSKEKKFFGARETFHPLPLGDPFRQHHRNRCDVCDGYGDNKSKGPLVFCQGCTFAYHHVCLGNRATREHLVTKVSDTLFILQCRRCLGVAYAKDTVCPHLGCCDECKNQGPMSVPLRDRRTPWQEQQLRESNNGKDPVTPVDMARVNNIDNLLFRCISCYRAFHFEHLPPLSDTTMSDMDTSSLRFEEYSFGWQCQDCASAPGEIGAMVAWRPNDPRNFEPGYTANVMEEVDKDYLIKWKGMSYYHTAWMAGSWVWGVASPSMRKAFFRSPKNQRPHMTSEEAIPEDFLRVDIIFDVRYSDNSDTSDQTFKGDIERVNEVVEAYMKFKGLPYEDALWESPPDLSHKERWGDFKAAYEDWVRRDYIHTPDQKALSGRLSSLRKRNFNSIVLNSQPETMTGGEIMDYQKDGINWLYYMWFKQQNAILADEMGLGKTIQAIGLFATLIQYHKCWPFLVVVPNSTCPNWRKEIQQWVPSVQVVTYYGYAFSRKLAHDYEMFPGGGRDLRCHIVVASYETITDSVSRRALSKVPWAGLVVDEGQRLKSDKTRIYEALSSIQVPFKLLLTGTPLQNNTRELFNILQFCDPSKNADALEAEYGVLSQENIPELHNMIRPFFLRRTKAQVLTFLPPIVQIIIPVSMSVVQKKLYKSILAKNPLLIKAVFQRSDGQALKQAERHNLNNILMQLRKCLCHPFVYSHGIEEHTPNATAHHRQLVEAAGKFQLLQVMLPKLQQRGHRVLIFSQFLANLDLVEDFLEGLGLQYRRLDGRMSSLQKQKQIDDFNADDSPYFAFLLSTRAGGVGINLASADTVVILDPDFNPHQDMQALSRAHRIGQKNKVLVFQLMTRASVEEKIMQIGRKKMVLDHVLIDRMVSDEDDGRDLESILRHGAQALFDNDDSSDIHYDSESVDRLLDRSQEQQARTPDQDAGESEFSFARVWTNDNQGMEGQLKDSEEDALPDPTVWEKILREREAAAAEEARKKAEAFGRGKRKRNAVDYTNLAADVTPEKPQRINRGAEIDAEFRGEEAIAAESPSDTEDDGEQEEAEPLPKKTTVRPFKRVNPNDPQIVAASMDGNMERAARCYVCKGIHPIGLCRLKLAGVEHCGLCGIAHFGKNRTCPHVRSEIQVTRMLDALQQSNEPPKLVKDAKKYLRGVRGHLVAAKRTDERGALASSDTGTVNGTPNTTSGAATPQPPSSSPPRPYLSAPSYPPSSAPTSAPIYARSSFVPGPARFASGVLPASTPNTSVIDLTGN